MTDTVDLIKRARKFLASDQAARGEFNFDDWRMVRDLVDALVATEREERIRLYAGAEDQ